MNTIIWRIVTIFVFGNFFITQAPAYAATAQDETAMLKQQIQQLQARVNQLEKQSTQEHRGPSRSFDQWDPFAEMDLIQRSMNRLFADSFAGGAPEFFNPRIDIKDTPNEYIITMDIPGMNKDNIEVKVENRQLLVSGERNSDTKEDHAGKFYRHERSFGHFMRAVPLPEDALTNKVDASYNNGVLVVKVGRSDKAKPAPAPQKITVK